MTSRSPSKRFASIAVAASTGLTPCQVVSAQEQSLIAAGEQLYEEHCAECHGEKLRSSGVVPDLRELPANDRARFDQAVKDGKGQMPAWEGILSAENLDQLWAYIRSRAR